MGSSCSMPAGKTTFDKDVVAEHLRKFSELEKNLKEANCVIDNLRTDTSSSLRMLNEERRAKGFLRHRITELETLLQKSSQLEDASTQRIQLRERQVMQLSADNDRLKTANATYRNQVSEFQSQNSVHQQTIDELTKEIKETKEKLNQESKKAAGTMKILTNERNQGKQAKEALKKQLAQLKNNKLFATKTALDDLKNRTEAVSGQIVGTAMKVNHRENYKMKFESLKDGNDRMIKDLETVTFTNRLYQTDLEELRKLQVETDDRSKDIFKTIQGITKDCKNLIEEYNIGFPERLRKAIANHERDLNILVKADLTPQFAKEDVLQESILKHLLKEKQMLEYILGVEKNNTPTDQVQNEKTKNSDNHKNQVQNNDPKKNNQMGKLDYTNNLGPKLGYAVVIYNMVEAPDVYADIVLFERCIRDITGRQISIDGVVRFGALGNNPRAAKITMRSAQDYEDLLKANPFASGSNNAYRHIRVVPFDPDRKKKTVTRVI